MSDIINNLISGAFVSLKIFIITAVVSLILGLILALLSRKKMLSKILNIYTLFFRGTPLMMQLILIMYGLPQLGIYVDRLLVAYIGFILNYTAYFIEIFKSGISSVDSEQIDAARAYGANEFQVASYIIIPQAFKLQLPVVSNELINLIKDTSIVTVIAVSDILRIVKEMVSNTFTLTPFLISTLFYLVISFIIVKTLKLVDKKIFN
ncbi:amino acid ABC transporter permease [Acholeplasma hippikon]|uniref:Arginine transport system permease protein ArtQ n=1 Tax=Acholeplasma hippikon TaxID=264636 RepID=A0A449BIN7_9MOLU|nr:amino acid ABC transporter permease [Acholeplasma hippikon]VEU82324.1 Arginine transport system permease protein ArtQ [Acholeplasma hippikon]